MGTSPPSEPVARPPWLNTPTCKLDRAGLPCGGPLTKADPGLTDGELICCACGRKSEATAEEEGQAARADEAWEREQNRAEIRHWLTHRGARPEAADDVEEITCAAMAVDMEGWTHGEIRDAVAVVLAAAGWKVDESALTAEAKISDLARRCVPVQLPARIKEITFKFTVGSEGLSTQDVRAAAAALAADSVKPDADGLVSIPTICPVCAEMDGWGCPEHRAAPLPKGATP